MFTLPTVKTAFCGCTPRQGSKIIAYIHLVGYSIALIVIIVNGFLYEHPESEVKDDLFSLNITNTTEENNETNPYEMEDTLIENSFLSLTSSYFNELVFLIQVVYAISLLIGIERKNLDLIFSWILLQITNVVFSQSLVMIYFIGFFSSTLNFVMFYLFFEEITLGIIEGYFIVVVNSYLKELTTVRENNDESLSPIVINSSSVDLRYPEISNNFVH